MYELSLFTGGSGGALATHCLMGWRQIGYVEIDKYCQKIIAQRIKDGIIPEAPIFGNIRTFISEGFAKSYKGLVDVITAGFPCQPFSVAGKRKGNDDTRNLWTETIECIRIIRPRFVFLENVPGLFAHTYARRIFGDMAEGGYDDRWRMLSAAEVGAPHKRDRVWIVAHTKITEECDVFSNPNLKRCEQLDIATESKGKGFSAGSDNKTRHLSWWSIEPDVGRVAHGVANRVDRLKVLGNGQVSGVVRKAWELLNEI